MDGAHPGGLRPGGGRGRGVPGRTPFAAAVPTGPEGRPRRAEPVPVGGFRKSGTARGAKRRPTPDAEVVTDAPACRTALGHAGRNHRAVRTGSGRGAARTVPFKRADNTFGNIRGAITGTYRKPGPDHAERHPAGFARRRNRRRHLRTMMPRFPHGAARTRPIP